MDWADKIAQRIFTGDGGALIDKPFYRGMIAKELRTARAEGMRTAAEICYKRGHQHRMQSIEETEAYDCTKAIIAAADKEIGQ